MTLTGRGSLAVSVAALGMAATAESAHAAAFRDYVVRGDLMRSYRRFSGDVPVRVAFMGGSVTTRQWRGPVMSFLRKRFPEARFDFIMAGIGGTDANLGAFRLPSQVFGRGQVDLFFLEFAVNGGGVRAMEGIVRQALRRNPDIDIVLMYFANTSHTKDYSQGRVPRIVQEHEKVAAHYRLPALFLYREIARRIAAGNLTWKEFSTDSVHPTQKGCDIYAECIIEFLKQAWKDPDRAPAPRGKLPSKLDPLCYENGRFVPLDAAVVKRGFRRVRKWSVKPTCNFRPPVDVLAADDSGAELSLTFTGRAIGLYTIIGMDAGIIEYSIDGGPFRKRDQFDHYCPRFHRPQYVIFADDLAPGEHTIVLRTCPDKNAKSTGHALRILQFMAN